MAQHDDSHEVDNSEPREDFDIAEEEPGREKCPICGRENHAGRMDVCEHFYALIWDGMTIWTKKGFDGALERAVRGLDEVMPELDEFVGLYSSSIEDEDLSDSVPDAPTCARHIARRLGLDPKVIDWAESPDVDPLERVGGFMTGSCWSTEGSFGGSGYTLYCGDPDALHALIEKLQALVDAIRNGMKDGEGWMTPEFRRMEEEHRKLQEELEHDRLYGPPVGADVLDYPFLVQEVDEYYRGPMRLLFNRQRKPSNCYLPVFRVEFPGRVRMRKGSLTPAASSAVVEEMKRFAAKTKRWICLVVDEDTGLYVDERGDTRFDVIPRGGNPDGEPYDYEEANWP